MDYKELALEFMQKLHVLKKVRPHKQIDESMKGESSVLQYLVHSEGAVLPSEISNKMRISTARIAATLNSMERKELITRRTDPSDRRRILVDLTPGGKAMANEHFQQIVNDVTKLLASLGEHDAREYVRITSKLAEYALQHKIRE